MVKRVSVYSLPKGTNPDEFWKYHTEVHASDIKKAAGPRLKKYAINRVARVVSGEPKFWGMVETWWESEEAIREATKDINALKAPGGKTIWDDFWSRVVDGFSAEVEEKEITL